MSIENDHAQWRMITSPGAEDPMAQKFTTLLGIPMKKALLLILALSLSGASLAQVGTTVKEGAKATAEKAKEVGDQTKAAFASEPNKTVDKAKAQEHKAKAHHHAKAAKEAAKEIPK